VKITSMIAIYALFWVMTAFIMLPFGVKTHDEAGIPKVPGQADSAPANFQPGKLALRASLIALAVTVIYIANYGYGWLTVADLDFTAPASAN
jgi:predicted secreted protein